MVLILCMLSTSSVDVLWNGKPDELALKDRFHSMFSQRLPGCFINQGRPCPAILSLLNLKRDLEKGVS